MNLQDYPHKRYNALTGEWILVSPHRTKRPWQGQVEDVQEEALPAYDPECYLCPGNSRAGGKQNPDYTDTFVFVNDFSALLRDVPRTEMNEKGLFVAQTEQGVCKVICFSPRHDLTVSLMETDDILKVVNVWCDEYRSLGEQPDIGYVQIFENRGAAMGCSNPHPHCQIWSTGTVPVLPALEQERQQAHRDEHGSCLLCDYLSMERKKNERIIFENDTFVVLVPFWAVWPFEVLTIPKVHFSSIDEMDEKQRRDFADAMRRTGIRYDNLFRTSFPYSMGIHQKPTDGKEHPEWHFHVHYLPPLLRSASVKKFMVGFELLAMPQRDITAESAADRLRGQSGIHYRREAGE